MDFVFRLLEYSVYIKLQRLICLNHSTFSVMSVFSFSILHAILLFLFCISLPLVSTGNFLGNETDRLALLAFKSQITLDPHHVTSSWNDSSSICEWEGVECGHRHRRVTVLSLGSNGLVGQISPYLGNLSFLRTLNLQNNSFHGDIPQELGHLFRLEILVLRNNSLVGKIPANISRCLNLMSLYLNYNNLVGNVPMELGYLPKLARLDLKVNNLTGGIQPSLANLTSLGYLSLSLNNLGGSIPSTLGQLKSLRIVELNSNELSGKFPLSLFNLSTFQSISIVENQLSGILPAEIGAALPNLENFYIGGNQFSGLIPTSLFNISRLQLIDVVSNQFTGNVPPNVGNLKDLRYLGVAGNDLGSGKSGDLDFITSLSNCTKLQYLSISANRFGGVLPTSIGNFSNQLSTIHLSENRIVGNIPTEIGNLQNLILLDLFGNFFSGSIPLSIGNLGKVELMELSGNQLSGQIPSSIRNMSRLFAFSFSHNFLGGSIASSLGNQILQILDLSHNNFTGSIPEQDFVLSSRLITLDLSYNSLSGSIPLEVGNLKNLQTLDVSENKMSGEIPSTVGSCSSLEYLYFQGNFFQKILPSSLGDLKGLQVLDVSRNNITGKIPKELEKLVVLQTLNLSFNDLEGEVPVKGIFQNASAISVVGNKKICGGIPELKLPKCNIQDSRKQGNSFALKITLGVLIPSFVVAMIIVIYFRKKPKAKPPPKNGTDNHKRVSYQDLYSATDGFSSTNLIGKGSTGSVFKGILQEDEAPIAVKVLNLMEPSSSKSFMAECEALRVVRHRNLLGILTVCSSADFNGHSFKALVFKFIPKGSLESWLHPNSDGQHLPRRLSLSQRLNIAIDIAYALQYLHKHYDRTIVHCDLKPSNVLLGDDMTAYVSDFGLSKFLSHNNSTSISNDTISIAIRGTIGYIPPEYGMGAKVSTQGDVYSYGILLLEMFTGKRPTDLMFKEGLRLHEFCKMALPHRVMDIIDMRLLYEETHDKPVNSISQMKECLSCILRIGVACSEELAIERMDIEDALREIISVRETYQV